MRTLLAILLLSPTLVGAALSVINYGAAGDCRQVWVSTTTNSVQVVFTNSISSADLNKTVLLFAVGQKRIGNNISGVYSTNYQDLIAVITNVVGSTAYLSGDIPQQTSNGVYCVYGTNNSYAFQAAVDAATGTNTVINIPAGNYLLIPPCQYTNFDNALPYPNYMALFELCGFKLYKGGITFQGEDRNTTILTGNGAWKNQGGYALRGDVFHCIGPITNDYPLVFDNLTFDGGVALGLAGGQGTQPANIYDGNGWDGTCAAGTDVGVEPLNSFKQFSHCTFRHMRGEMLKGVTGSAWNETIQITNCFFWDGNATAFNYNFAHTITGCTFSNMYQIEEFFLRWPTNAPSFFVNNYATNITHNFISLNGGTSSNQPYVISNNVFYQTGGNGIGTTPASNVQMVSNVFNCLPTFYSFNIVLGMAGYQGYWCNSNIVIRGNRFTNAPSMVLQIAGGTSGNDPERVVAVDFYHNTIQRADDSVMALQAYNWCADVHFFSNDFSGVVPGVSFNSGNYGSPFVTVDLNNNYFTLKSIDSGNTNYLSYAGGSRYQLTGSSGVGTKYALVTTNANQIPAGAQILILNNNTSSAAVPVYLNSELTGNSVSIPAGESQTFAWSDFEWLAEPLVTVTTLNIGTLYLR